MTSLFPAPAFPRRAPKSTSPLRHGEEDRILALFGVEKHDTATIAQILGLREAEVYNVIARRPKPARPALTVLKTQETF